MADPEIPSRESLAARVRLPAVFLLVAGGLNLLAALLFLTSFLHLYAMDDEELRDTVKEQVETIRSVAPDLKQKLDQQQITEQDLVEQMRLAIPLSIGSSAAMVLVAAVSIFGGWKMLRFRSRGWAIAGAILVSMPCLSPLGCCLMGEAVGLWCLVVLVNEDVAAAFGKGGNP